MDCDNVQDAILDSFIEAPSAGTRTMIDAHISGCQSCAAFAEAQYRLDRQLNATLVPPVLSDGFRAAVRASARREARTLWPDLLPDAMHFGGCAVATVIGLV